MIVYRSELRYETEAMVSLTCEDKDFFEAEAERLGTDLWGLLSGLLFADARKLREGTLHLEATPDRPTLNLVP